MESEVYQLFTVISEDDEEDLELKYTNDDDESDSNQVMYLTYNQSDDEDVLLQDGTSSQGEELSYKFIETPGPSSPNLKLITLSDGQIFLSGTNDSDEFAPFTEGILPEITLEEATPAEVNADQELEVEGKDENMKGILLEDGTTALIDGTLWNSLISELNTTEPAPKKQGKFVCKYEGCNKEYTSGHHLTVHVRNHTGVRPYSCTFEGCDKAFATSYSLKAHTRIHTGEKPYGCTICMKHFKTSGDLQKHFRTHTGEKPFKCPVAGCNRSFTTSNIRKVHIRSHTGERPYVCEYQDCGKAFASATNYKNHIRIHSGEKPYVCQVEDCGKCFTEYSSLYKHNAVHQTLKRFKCCYCGMLCKQESSLRAHKRTIHQIIITEEGTEIFLAKEDPSNRNLLFEISKSDSVILDESS